MNANTQRLQQRFHHRLPWLATLTTPHRRFHHRLEGRRIEIRVKS